ncbi:hypothetical protein L202_01761 [Cryptococcus amylolentus CBS 6039]|uniref:NAD(+) diphosphatase n=2 Tax=Cryptococcus amylolentus TaxID=104669 RepID=A0A1E3I4S9_9TREE|nr:hypothetical protein L202_01761 [Cryptococcus amylolentus CBS 6039]ODN83664.1 hypothetical protein L202_01761 [Cryptococcus amylolentus CBS 6039]
MHRRATAIVSPIQTALANTPRSIGPISSRTSTSSIWSLNCLPNTALSHQIRSHSAFAKNVYMGDNIVNFFAGQPPLNRIAFQRHELEKVNHHLHNPETQFFLFKDFKPLVKKGEAAQPLYLRKDDVKDLIGEGYRGPSPGATLEISKISEVTRLSLPNLIFLGIDDRQDPTTNKSSAVDHLNPKGTPYFALDATGTSFDEAALGGEWGDPRASGSAFGAWDAGVFAEARALIDWNGRNKFCPACGSKTYSLWAGWKRSCITALNPIEGQEPCFSTKGLHNFAYPRTDPVIIMGILDSTGEHMLLGRQKSWPKGMYSCLAGFIEPGESFEDSVRREVLEEAGIEVGPVRYSSSQPWPFPANLMVGCFGRAKDGQTIRFDLDNELEDAQWFPRSTILSVISNHGSSNYTRDDHKKLEDKSDADKATAGALAPSERTQEDLAKKTEGKDVTELTRVPPESAIAGVLIRQWAKGGLDLVSKL